MSYTVLARRYRSGTFDEVIGQDHVAQTLKKAISSGRIAHAYLFCGTRGTGKTSMARILAKALNCHSFDAPTTEPCGTCDSCVRIARGDDIDVIEIDAASNTGVDNVRDVIENSRYRPTRSRFKIYIVDEAHMLSKPAFNALLKTLEEPPSHVKFILATTEPEKLLPTILSRCQRYDFRNIPTREIAAHLADICKREKIDAEEEALLLVAKAGAGSMRDSLSLLDRLLSVGEKHLTADMIEQLLGLPKSQLLFDLAEAIGAGDVKGTLGKVDAMVQGGLSVDSLVSSLVDHLRNLMILKTCGPDSTLVEVPGLAMNDLVAQAERFDVVAITQDITILEELRRTLRQSQAGRPLLDATLVRMALSDQFASIGELLSRLDGNGSPPRAAPARTAPRGSAPAAAPAQKKNLEPVNVAAAGNGTGVRAALGEASSSMIAPAAPTPTEPAAPVSVAISTGPASTSEPLRGAEAPSASSDPNVVLPAAAAPTAVTTDEDDDLPAPGKVWAGPSESLATLMARHKASSVAAPASPAAPPVAPPPAPDSNVEAVNATDLPKVWQAMLGLLADHGPMLHSLVSQGQLVAIDDGRIILRFGPQLETFVKAWDKNGKREMIQEAASKVLNKTIGVKFEIDGDANGDIAVAPAAPPAMRPSAPVHRPAAARPTPQHAPPPAPEAAGAPAVKITSELVDAIKADQPLVKAVMEKLGGQVIKVE